MESCVIIDNREHLWSKLVGFLTALEVKGGLVWEKWVKAGTEHSHWMVRRRNGKLCNNR